MKLDYDCFLLHARYINPFLAMTNKQTMSTYFDSMLNLSYSIIEANKNSILDSDEDTFEQF